MASLKMYPAMLGPPASNCTFIPVKYEFTDPAEKMVPAGTLVVIKKPKGAHKKRKASAYANIPVIEQIDRSAEPTTGVPDNYAFTTDGGADGGMVNIGAPQKTLNHEDAGHNGDVIGIGITHDDFVRPIMDRACTAYVSVVVHGVCNLRENGPAAERLRRIDRNPGDFLPYAHFLDGGLNTNVVLDAAADSDASMLPIYVVQRKGKGDAYVRVMIDSSKVGI